LTRVLFALSDTGRGHRSVAEAIARSLRQSNPGTACEIVDIYKDLRVPILDHAGAIYAAVSRSRVEIHNMWSLALDGSSRSRGAARLLYRLVARRLIRLIGEHSPDIVVSTHPLFLSDLFAQVRVACDFQFLLATVVSDPITVHASWAAPEADLTFVVSDDAKRQVVHLGVPPDRVRRVEFPVHPDLLCPFSRSEARQRLKLPRESPVVLIGGGGAGSGNPEVIGRRLQAAGWPGPIVVAVGTNRRLERSARDFAITISDPESVFDALRSADVFVTKAGPSAIFEAAAIGVPLFVTKEVGRQERGNARFAEQSLGAMRWRTATATSLVASASSLQNTPRIPHLALAGGATQIAAELLSLADIRAAQNA
jgi:UDP-N-acetylglucosamine:LPS N-acetylglucosamine transferase